MGNQNGGSQRAHKSAHKSVNNGSRALNMLQVKPQYGGKLYGSGNEQLSVNFTRNDLVDSVSALSLGTQLKPMNGGGAHYSENSLHPNAPSHSTYLKYKSTKTMDMNGGGVINNLSSESEGDWNNIKSLIFKWSMGLNGEP